MKQIVTSSEVAELFGVTPQAVRIWANQGLLPYFLTPRGQRRFRRVDIDAFIAGQSRAAS